MFARGGPVSSLQRRGSDTSNSTDGGGHVRNMTGGATAGATRGGVHQRPDVSRTIEVGPRQSHHLEPGGAQAVFAALLAQEFVSPLRALVLDCAVELDDHVQCWQQDVNTGRAAVRQADRYLLEQVRVPQRPQHQPRQRLAR